MFRRTCQNRGGLVFENGCHCLSNLAGTCSKQIGPFFLTRHVEYVQKVALQFRGIIMESLLRYWFPIRIPLFKIGVKHVSNPLNNDIQDCSIFGK